LSDIDLATKPLKSVTVIAQHFFSSDQPMKSTQSNLRRLVAAALGRAALLFAGVMYGAENPASGTSFTVAGDMRSYTENAKPDGKRFFDGACEAMSRVGPGSFLISPGDFDPPAANRAVIDKYLGKQFPWYVVVGNHEVENAVAMPWVREWLASDMPNVGRRGVPGTTLTVYSFDVGNSHFVAIDSYPLAKQGKPNAQGKVDAPGNKGEVDLTEAEFKWLEEDLAATKKQFIWVIGHQPIESIPDMDSGRGRHGGESVSYDPGRAARFVDLLKKYHVRAYICGHTHNASVTKLASGIWQADSGHARGGGDTGAPSTFLKVRTSGTDASVEIYRANPNGDEYQLRQTVALQ
jgi:3',5'-cyclic AMP phosphodiesterase CpdA